MKKFGKFEQLWICQDCKSVLSLYLHRPKVCPNCGSLSINKGIARPQYERARHLGAIFGDVEIVGYDIKNMDIESCSYCGSSPCKCGAHTEELL